jgi:cytochrome c5
MRILRTIAFALSLGAAGLAFAGTAAESPKLVEQSTAASAKEVNEQWIIEGEKRYRINCGRCHQPPRIFSPRAMSTAVRHMRVRGMLTEEDMKYVLYYMTHQ